MSSTINHAYSSLSIGDSDQLTHTVTEGDVRPGDTLTVNVEVVALHEHKPVATLACTVTNQNDELVTDGESVVLVPKNAMEVEMPQLPRFEEI